METNRFGVVEKQTVFSSQTQQVNAITATHSPISCTNCRRAHRKCDKLLPKCSECSQRDLDKVCTYHSPKKRGPKQTLQNKRKNEGEEMDSRKVLMSSSSECRSYYDHQRVIVFPSGNGNNNASMYGNTSELVPPAICNNSDYVKLEKSSTKQMPSPQVANYESQLQLPPQTNIIDELRQMVGLHQLSHKYMKPLLDIYYDWVCLGYPPLDKTSTELFFKTHFPYLVPKVELLSPFSLAEEARLAHIESMILCTLQRIGCKYLARQLFAVIKQRLAKFFDQVYNQYDISCAMVHVCTFLAGEGQLQQSNIYFTLANTFVKEEKQRQDTNTGLISLGYLKALQNYCQFCDVILLTDTLARIRAIGRLFSMLFLNSSFDDTALDPTRYASDFEYLHGIMDCIDNLELKTKVFHYQGLSQQAQSLGSEINNAIITQFSISDVHYDLMLNGIRLSIFIKLGILTGDIVKRYADRVTAITQSPWFPKCAMSVIDAVVNCVTVHLADANTDPFLLERDIIAMRILNERFDIINKTYGTTLNALEERINAKETQSLDRKAIQ